MPDTERPGAGPGGDGPVRPGRDGAGSSGDRAVGAGEGSGRTGAAGSGAASAPSCMLCGTVAESVGAAALTWVLERDDRGRAGRLCPACARRHVRDIEAKLAPEWW